MVLEQLKDIEKGLLKRVKEAEASLRVVREAMSRLDSNHRRLKTGELEERVLSCLRLNPEGMTSTEISEEGSFSTASVSGTLSRLYKAGRLDRVREGKSFLYFVRKEK